MIPEAFEETRTWTGLIASLGFLVAFAIEFAWGKGLVLLIPRTLGASLRTGPDVQRPDRRGRVTG